MPSLFRLIDLELSEHVFEYLMPPVVILEANFTKDILENANYKTILQAEIKVILFP